MPWYYAGPEGKPVGPISLEELQGRRRAGVLAAETYVIEHTGQTGQALAWRRYREVFPDTFSTPPPPPTHPFGATLPAIPAHPLFPSAGAATTPPAYAGASTGSISRPTNGLCFWGFILSGIGVL